MESLQGRNARGGSRADLTGLPVKDSSLYKPFTKLIQDRLAVSLTAAKILAVQGTQDQGIMKMEPKEEQAWEYKTRLHGNYSFSQEIFHQYSRQLCYQETSGPQEALS
uniref:Zinc finger protein 232 n=1 Tax=Rousettus aegyptiacus TaxID=9407 RepID=A0A7J8GI99_ROUAE|nr:zinc finger protein 232 [Rousettus aegyptiacus]